ncbi:unnamed protein product [Acanthoscelides obtectus]|uniref:Uncharacterized protein n=1 Tax=Acanthoscelides obtectus TaxID=200917 RepID=A0A9P0QH00_ACAOB|nr:unnamed protein product [Acanthoscelides obtectus]CAK1683890.1 hypothetical protein AOBTE_LOCUS34507 [Acanthoscelides obtectus]
MKNILVIKKTDDAVRPLSPQPDPSKASTSVQEESEETRPSTTSELDSTPDSDNSVSNCSILSNILLETLYLKLIPYGQLYVAGKLVHNYWGLKLSPI